VGLEFGGVKPQALCDLFAGDAVDWLTETPDGRVELLRHVPGCVDLWIA